ncbi:molybdate ABC transporter substrate-binding protein [Fodinisporobacter ferrooxydans]|uniref:Molybdate ABC transporter substrate-binding protein n=1 Tax=Fodinisporobacter ferrooxydans TaxID=2901836 RepID=A0ABY4CKM1_9BACL|nr:molybdate ABC transporter substrate-binding protein [Alicyclobacillaceae bacterium MYW30-H2]
MGKFRSLLAVAAVSLLGLQAVSGCGQTTTQKQQVSQDAKGNQGASGQAAQPQQELVVSAAASLKDSLDAISKQYEKEHPNTKIDFNFGASGDLEQQIEQGAPADLFFSAGIKEMNQLEKKQLISANQEKVLLSNQLVVITPAKNGAAIHSIADLERPDIQKVALGQPQTVPAGSYTKDALVHDQLWQHLQSKFVFGKDVRQVLSYVETGNVDAGFVYKTDAMTSKQVHIAFAVDPKSYKPIAYPVGIVKNSKQKEAAKSFYEFLQTPENKKIFETYGFTMEK